jgi:hypothetical protein
MSQHLKINPEVRLPAIPSEEVKERCALCESKCMAHKMKKSYHFSALEIR